MGISGGKQLNGDLKPFKLSHKKNIGKQAKKPTAGSISLAKTAFDISHTQ